MVKDGERGRYQAAKSGCLRVLTCFERPGSADHPTLVFIRIPEAFLPADFQFPGPVRSALPHTSRRDTRRDALLSLSWREAADILPGLRPTNLSPFRGRIPLSRSLPRRSLPRLPPLQWRKTTITTAPATTATIGRLVPSPTIPRHHRRPYLTTRVSLRTLVPRLPSSPRMLHTQLTPRPSTLHSTTMSIR